MPCDTRLKPRQTISDRAAEVRKATAKLASLLASGQVKPVVSKKGGIAFQGWSEADRDGVTDACVYRRLLTTPGASLALAKIKQAEMIAGRSVDKQVLAGGHHSHDGGQSWHDGH
jgi:hypothetical protein